MQRFSYELARERARPGTAVSVGSGPSLTEPGQEEHVEMAQRPRSRPTPRPPSSIQPWLAPTRNLDWIAARIGLA